MKPQVLSLKRYGLRVKNGVRTRTIMNRPVATTDSPAATMAR